MTDRPTSRSSPGSGGSTSPLKPSGSDASDKSSGMSPVDESLSDGGRMFPVGLISGSSQVPTSFDAYAAGLIDGEGSIMVWKNQRWFYPRLRVKMSVKARVVLDRLAAEYGGEVRAVPTLGERHADQIDWQLMGEQAARCLARVHPWLVLKVEQSVLALALWDMIESLPPSTTGRGRAWSASAFERAATMKRRMTELNRTGPSLISSAEGSPVSLSLKPASARVRPTSGGSGPSSPVLLASYDPATSSWRTPQGSLLSTEDERFPRSWETWPRSGMTRGGRAYALPMSERVTAGSESSYLHTPRATRGGASTENQRDLLPTPKANEWKGRGVGEVGRQDFEDKRNLKSIGHLLPTPRTTDAQGKGKHGEGGLDLRTSLGDLTRPPSDDTKKPSDDPSPDPSMREDG